MTVERREAWVDLFITIQYNTPLSSSAAVERDFATGDILRPNRTTLAIAKFDKLVFNKGNMSLLAYPTYKGQFEEEKQLGAKLGKRKTGEMSGQKHFKKTRTDRVGGQLFYEIVCRNDEGRVPRLRTKDEGKLSFISKLCRSWITILIN